MYEEIITCLICQPEAGEKVEMSFWDRCEQFFLDARKAVFRRYALWNPDSIAVRRGVASQFEPGWSHGGIVQELQKQLLVISLDIDRLESGKGISKKELDDAPAFEASSAAGSYHSHCESRIDRLRPHTPAKRAGPCHRRCHS